MEEVTGFRTLLHMWKHIFDYRGRASRKEYWIPFLVHAGIMVAALMCLGVSAVLREVSYSAGFSAGRWIAVFFAVAGVVLFLYLIISILPWISLTIRRLHDAGKSGWWTILLLVVGIGTVILLFLCSLQTTSSALNRGGRFDPSRNFEETIYGPPGMFDDYDPNKNMNEDIYGPPEMYEDYDPDKNMNEDIYGPPEMFEDYDPEENMNEDIYGPPEMFEDYDPEENMEPDIYGPPEMFEDYDPGNNIEPTIYGPPEMLEESKTEETVK